MVSDSMPGMRESLDRGIDISIIFEISIVTGGRGNHVNEIPV